MATTIFYVPCSKQPSLIVTASSTLSSTSTLTDVLDGNHNTYISFSTAAGKKTIDFDFGGQTTDGLKAVGLFLNNYTTNFGAAFIGASGSNNGTLWGKLTPHATTLTHNGQPNFYTEFSGSAKFRYYRLAFANLPAVPNIAEVYWFRKESIPRNFERENSNVQPRYFNKTADLDGGYQYVTYNYSNPIDVYRRSYKLITLPEIQTIERVFDSCRGQRYPFLYQSGSTVQTSVFARFQDDTPDWSGHPEISYREVELRFNSIPFISSGESI